MFDMALRIKIAMDMTTLTVFRNHAISLIYREVPPQGIVERFGMTSREAQERTQRAKDSPVLHRMPLEWKGAGHRRGVREESGRWDLNPRPSAWEADTLPLSYSRNAAFYQPLTIPDFDGPVNSLMACRAIAIELWLDLGGHGCYLQGMPEKGLDAFGHGVRIVEHLGVANIEHIHIRLFP